MANSAWEAVKKTWLRSAVDLSNPTFRSTTSSNADAQIDGGEAPNPGAFAFLHFRQEQKRDHADKHEDPTERIFKALNQIPELVGKPKGVVEYIFGIGGFILAAAQGVEEALDGARITPLHRRAGHPGQRLVEIK